MSTSLGCFAVMNCWSAATKASGVYGSSLGDSTAYAFATFLAATSRASSATLAPTTAASRVQPVAAAMAWAAVMVSRETRFSLPSRCSMTTRIVSGIRNQLLVLPSAVQGRSCRALLGRAAEERLSPHESCRQKELSQHVQFVAQFV